MKKIIWQSAAAIGLMAIAYYLNNPKKYNRKAKRLGVNTSALVNKLQPLDR